MFSKVPMSPERSQAPTRVLAKIMERVKSIGKTKLFSIGLGRRQKERMPSVSVRGELLSVPFLGSRPKSTPQAASCGLTSFLDNKEPSLARILKPQSGECSIVAYSIRNPSPAQCRCRNVPI